MLNDVKEIIKKDSKLRYILLGGLLLQLSFSLSTTGYYKADQHFSVIEFSLYQLGEPNATSHVWEFEKAIRPTIQVYLFSAYYTVLQTFGISDPYTKLTVLRVLIGLLLLIVFNIISIYYSKNKTVMYVVLIILNFSWCLPYIRTLFNSEMLSSLFFFGAAFMYDRRKNLVPGFTFLFLTGFLFCLAFYFRFQTAFLIIGFIFWMMFIQKKWKHIIPLTAGFIAGVIINTWMDYEFYNRFVITPYEYYYANIILKMAASFGTEGPYVYVAALLSCITIIPISFFLFYYAGKASWKNYSHMLLMPVLLFIVAHCFISHKEERFMFPVLCILPVIIGWGIPEFQKYYTSCKKKIRFFINSIIALSILLNTMGMFIVMFHNPYTQHIQFASRLNNFFNKTDTSAKIYFAGNDRNPFITSTKLPTYYYANAFKKTEMIFNFNADSISLLKEENVYLATTFDIIKNHRGMIDSLGYKPVFYSSGFLWKINDFLYAKKRKGVSRIWVLYKKINNNVITKSN